MFADPMRRKVSRASLFWVKESGKIRLWQEMKFSDRLKDYQICPKNREICWDFQ